MGSRYDLSTEEIRVLNKVMRKADNYENHHFTDEGLLYDCDFRIKNVKGELKYLISDIEPKDVKGLSPSEVCVLIRLTKRLYK